MTITLIIATKNRPGQLNACLNTVSKAISKHDNVVVVDQSNNSSAALNRQTVKKFKSMFNLLYFSSSTSGLSKARNIGVAQATGEILAFTDDDCLIDKQWFVAIRNSFQKYPSISGVVGSTLPYGRPPTNNHSCPCIHKINKISLISSPGYHGTIGFGNCMAFRQTALPRNYPFKQWLGVGSIGLSAEDAEILLRLLIHKNTILNNPHMIVYHNRWITGRDLQSQNLLYACGEMACYGYFSIKGHRFALQVVWTNIKESSIKTRRLLKRFLFFNWNKKIIADSQSTILEFIYRIRGLSIGSFKALTSRD